MKAERKLTKCSWIFLTSMIIVIALWIAIIGVEMIPENFGKVALMSTGITVFIILAIGFGVFPNNCRRRGVTLIVLNVLSPVIIATIIGGTMGQLPGLGVIFKIAEVPGLEYSSVLGIMANSWNIPGLLLAAQMIFGLIEVLRSFGKMFIVSGTLLVLLTCMFLFNPILYYGYFYWGVGFAISLVLVMIYGMWVNWNLEELKMKKIRDLIKG